MNNVVKVVTLLSLNAATLLASGYRIPEQSLNGTALGAAYVAGANGADASYYNPANMAFMADGASLEAALTYINLPKIKYDNSATNPFGPLSGDGSSLVEQFLLPTFHYVSPKQGNFRYGLSIVAPGGLSKRWDEAYAKATAEEFSLKVIEINPTMSYMFNDQFAMGFGLRALYSEGVVRSNALDALGVNLSRDMEGDSIDFGYNLALSYKPIKDLTFAATYRSKVELTEKGTAKISYMLDAAPEYNNDTSVMLPLPASLALAVAYDFEKTKVEFVFERTYWSAYKELDFKYNSTLPAFDAPKAKNWKDVNAYRIGITHQYNDKLKLMAGFAIDKNGAPDNTIGFELPESDAKLYSIGFDYKLNEKMNIGLAYLYDQKESRTVSNASAPLDPSPSGTFTNASAHLVTASLKYKF